MKKILFLKLLPFDIRKIVGVADAVMRADKDKVVRIVEECANRRNFSATRLLAGSKGIEADHDQRVARVQNGVIQRNLRAIVANPFDLDNRTAGLSGCLRDEFGEIRLHDVIQEPRNALIETRRIGEVPQIGGRAADGFRTALGSDFQ
jgi:hypothetical protein